MKEPSLKTCLNTKGWFYWPPCLCIDKIGFLYRGRRGIWDTIRWAKKVAATEVVVQ